MCGAGSEQKDMFKKQSSFYDTLTANFSTVFASAKGILDTITDVFSPIVKAGPNQQGFSAEELTARNNQVQEGTAKNYEKASQALGEQQASAGGGNALIPTGAASEQREQLAAAAAGKESELKNDVTRENYATGRANFEHASAVLSGAPNVMNAATGYATAANGAGEAAASTAKDIAASSNSWMGAVGGVLGQAAGGYLSGASWT